MSALGNKEIMASNIKRYMDLYKKDRNDICKDLGFKYTTFTDWINGNTYPRIDKIEMMANYFGISKADLVEAPSILVAPTIIEYFNKLNDEGKAEATKRVEELTFIPRYTAASGNIIPVAPKRPVLNAAQQRTDIEIPEDVDTSDNDIMLDENF